MGNVSGIPKDKDSYYLYIFSSQLYLAQHRHFCTKPLEGMNAKCSVHVSLCFIIFPHEQAAGSKVMAADSVVNFVMEKVECAQILFSF